MHRIRHSRLIITILVVNLYHKNNGTLWSSLIITMIVVNTYIGEKLVNGDVFNNYYISCETFSILKLNNIKLDIGSK